MYQMFALQTITGLAHDEFETFAVEKFNKDFGQKMSEVAEEEIAGFMIDYNILDSSDEEVEDTLHKHHDEVVGRIASRIKFYPNHNDIAHSSVEIDGKMY